MNSHCSSSPYDIESFLADVLLKISSHPENNPPASILGLTGAPQNVPSAALCWIDQMGFAQAPAVPYTTTFNPYYNATSHNSPIPLVPFSPLPMAGLDVPAPSTGYTLAPPPLPRRSTIDLPDVDDYVEPAIDFDAVPPPYSPGPPAYYDISTLNYPPTIGARRMPASLLQIMHSVLEEPQYMDIGSNKDSAAVELDQDDTTATIDSQQYTEESDYEHWGL